MAEVNRGRRLHRLYCQYFPRSAARLVMRAPTNTKPADVLLSGFAQPITTRNLQPHSTGPRRTCGRASLHHHRRLSGHRLLLLLLHGRQWVLAPNGAEAALGEQGRVRVGWVSWVGLRPVECDDNGRGGTGPGAWMCDTGHCRRHSARCNRNRMRRAAAPSALSTHNQAQQGPGLTPPWVA